MRTFGMYPPHKYHVSDFVLASLNLETKSDLWLSLLSNGCSVATTGFAPSAEAKSINLLISPFFIPGARELAFICMYQCSDSLDAKRSTGHLLPLDNFTFHPSAIMLSAIINSASLPDLLFE